MPVVNGVYLKDFAALPGAVDDANIIPIAISGNQIAYRTTVSGIITDARITGKLLTGLSVTGGTVVATDTILQAFGKVQNQVNNKVPYTGATGDVDLGVHSLLAESITLDSTPATIPTAQGSMYFDEDEQTLAVILNGTTQKVGEDVFFQIKNQTGSTIPKGTAVRFDGIVGASGRIKAVPFLANGTYPSLYFLGVTSEEILDGGDGKAYMTGKIRGLNTNAYTIGTILYCSTTVAGGFQTTAPIAPNNIISVAAVIAQSATVGSILVRPQIGSNINNDEGVKIVSGTTGDLLQLQSGGLWENKAVGTVMSNYVDLTTDQSIGGFKTFSNSVKIANGASNGLNLEIGTSGNYSALKAATSGGSTNILLPASNGTLALTSDLGFYLPLTGGTLTGALNGTSASFSSTISAVGGSGTGVTSTTTTGTALRGTSSGAGEGLYATSDSGVGANINSTTGKSAQFTSAGSITTISVTNNSTGDIATFANSGGTVFSVKNGGTLSNGTYIYNLPSATGTLALVGGAGVGTVTSVAALTLGTTGTDLSSSVANGTTTPVITLNVPDASATARGVITTGTQTIAGAKNFTSSISISGGNALQVESFGTGNYAYLQAPLGLSGGIVLNLPSTGGTLALTSALSSYLPLAGGTLTGALSGTSATFTGSVVSNAIDGAFVISGGVTNRRYIEISNVGGSGKFGIESNAGGGIITGSTGYDMAMTGSSGICFSGNGGTNLHARLSNTGDFSIGTSSGGFKLNVNGTGNFSDRVIVGDLSGSSPLVWARSGGVSGYLYSDSDNVGFSNVLDFGAGYEGILLNTTTSSINFYTNGVSTPRLTIASTGAATFSSTVTTAAPSGGTAKPFKIGAAATVSPTSPNRTIEIEIDGTTYYLTAKTTND